MPSSNPRLTIFVAAALGCAAAFSQSLPMASHPEDVGFSSKRLEAAKAVFKNDVDTKRVPGAVLLIARNGKIAFFDAVGFQDRAAQTPMKKDSIFRIASMSSPSPPSPR
jgi:CubicO group peptidase (beta-lactamase class C family)